MKRLFAGLVIVLLVSLMLVGCSKDEQAVEDDQSSMELPPFPDEEPDDAGDAMVAIEPASDEPDLLGDDEVDIGDVV